MDASWYGNLVLPDKPVTKEAVARAVRSLNHGPAPVAPRTTGTLTAYEPGIADRIQSAVADALMNMGSSPFAANQFGKKAASFLNDLTPVGAAVSAEQAKNDFSRGNYISGLMNSALTALGAVPDLGPLAGKVSHSIIAPLFHGSPHKFEKFALEKIGTGEGAQAYGHGLYFAENPEVADQYRKVLGHRANAADDPASAAAFWTQMHGGDTQAATKTFQSIRDQNLRTLERAAKGLPLAPGAEAHARSELEKADAALAHLASGVEPPIGGHLYEVKLDANPEDFLNWDAKLGEQPDIASRVSTLDNPLIQAWQQNGAFPHVSGQTLYRQLADGLTNGAAARGVPVTASQSLNAAGIPGIRYLDQGSRGAGQGTHNYVVFDPGLIEILNRR